MADDASLTTAYAPGEPDGGVTGPLEMLIDWAIRGSEALRKHLRISEQMFVRTHGQAVADTRDYFLYAALDECQKVDRAPCREMAKRSR